MESIGGNLQEMQRIPLTPAHVAALREAGAEVVYAAGTYLTRPGQLADRFVYVLDGEIEVVNAYTDERHLPSTLGPTQFMGEITFLNGGNVSMAMRAVRDTTVIEVPRATMLALISQIPDMSDIIITVYAARRRRQIEQRDSALVLIGEELDRDVRRIAEFASRNRIPYSSFELGSAEANAVAATCSLAPGRPAVIFGRDMGFPTGISGADLVWRGEIQAMKFGTRFAMPRRVARLEALDDGSFCATFDTGARIRARTVVVATGVQYRRLPIERLTAFEGSGVYYAATDIEARYSKGTEAIIIGGGNSAGQAAMFLSRTASRVRLLVRGQSLAASMSSYLSSRLEADPAITIEFGAEVSALHGIDHLEAVTIRDTASGSEEVVPSRALFIMVGAAPNTDWLMDLVELDEKGFVLTGAAVGASSSFAASRPGIFAVGDVRSGSVKRVASAVGEGSVVISKVWEFAEKSRGRSAR